MLLCFIQMLSLSGPTSCSLQPSTKTPAFANPAMVCPPSQHNPLIINVLRFGHINYGLYTFEDGFKFSRHNHCILFCRQRCSGSQAQGNWLSVWGNVNQLKALPHKLRNTVLFSENGVQMQPEIPWFMKIPPVFPCRSGYLPWAKFFGFDAFFIGSL